MTDNIFPKYVEISPRRTGKSTRLLQAVALFEEQVFRDIHVVVISPNMNMSHHLRNTYRSDYDISTRISNNREVLFKTMSYLDNNPLRGVDRNNIVLFMDEVYFIRERFPFWVPYRTIYVTTTPVNNSHDLLREIIIKNNNYIDVYRNDV